MSNSQQQGQGGKAPDVVPTSGPTPIKPEQQAGAAPIEPEEEEEEE